MRFATTLRSPFFRSLYASDSALCKVPSRPFFARNSRLGPPNNLRSASSDRDFPAVLGVGSSATVGGCRTQELGILRCTGIRVVTRVA